jgi:hypothetical protein
MTSFASNIKSAFERNADENELDRGNLVETILIIAGLAVVAILVINWIGTAIINKGADIAACIEGSNTFEKAGASEKNCSDQNHAGEGDNSFTKSDGYTGRFGD